MDLTLLESSVGMPNLPTQLCDDLLSDLVEIGDSASWSLSSAKPGNGMPQLRDNNSSTFWQSDGQSPHTVTLRFPRKTKVSVIDLYLAYKIDESYTPQIISIRSGNQESDLEEIKEMQLSEPDGWVRILLSPREIADNFFKDAMPMQIKTICDSQNYISTFCIQIAILANHQTGRDTHVRQIRVWGPREISSNAIGRIPITQPIKMGNTVETRMYQVLRSENNQDYKTKSYFDNLNPLVSYITIGAKITIYLISWTIVLIWDAYEYGIVLYGSILCIYSFKYYLNI
ncbi:anaphase-promoting complex subunit 10 [Cryptosporidium felis]|nr:anaphase-promoting complex subunit 10 [Cryptosporidium felis]